MDAHPGDPCPEDRRQHQEQQWPVRERPGIFSQKARPPPDSFLTNTVQQGNGEHRAHGLNAGTTSKCDAAWAFPFYIAPIILAAGNSSVATVQKHCAEIRGSTRKFVREKQDHAVAWRPGTPRHDPV